MSGATTAPGSTLPPIPRERLALALDLVDRKRLVELVRTLAPEVGVMKLGSIPYAAFGPDLVREVAASCDVFLDLKLHDIPNTVAGAIAEAARHGVAMLTIHASGGPAMIAAATRAADAAKAAGLVRPRILAVTVLTHIDDAELARIGFGRSVGEQVLALASMAVEAGADGIVCSAHEVATLRAKLGPGPTLVVPGIRPAGAAGDDQRRTATPRAAIDAGADLLVIGRPILDAADAVAAARALRA